MQYTSYTQEHILEKINSDHSIVNNIMEFLPYTDLIKMKLLSQEYSKLVKKNITYDRIIKFNPNNDDTYFASTLILDARLLKKFIIGRFGVDDLNSQYATSNYQYIGDNYLNSNNINIYNPKNTVKPYIYYNNEISLSEIINLVTFLKENLIQQNIIIDNYYLEQKYMLNETHEVNVIGLKRIAELLLLIDGEKNIDIKIIPEISIDQTFLFDNVFKEICKKYLKVDTDIFLLVKHLKEIQYYSSPESKEYIPKALSSDCNISSIEYMANTDDKALKSSESPEVVQLFNYIANSPSLNTLYISYNKIDDPLLKILSKNKNIQTLNLLGNLLTPIGVNYLMNIDKLETIVLDRNNIGDLGASIMSLKSNLNYISAAMCSIGDEGAKALAANNNLKFLDLAYNKIGNAGASALIGNDNIQVLRLSSNKIDDNGAKRIISILQDKYNILSIQLNDNNISYKNLEIITELVDRNNYIFSKRNNNISQTNSAHTHIYDCNIPRI